MAKSARTRKRQSAGIAVMAVCLVMVIYFIGNAGAETMSLTEGGGHVSPVVYLLAALVVLKFADVFTYLLALIDAQEAEEEK